MDLVDEVRPMEQAVRRPERQHRRQTPPVEIGTHGSVEQQRRTRLERSRKAGRCAITPSGTLAPQVPER